MYFAPYADQVGEIDGRRRPRCETLYLLDKNLCIIGVRGLSDDNEPQIGPNDYFFDRFPASREEKNELARLLHGLCFEGSYLMRAGGRPVLILCEFYARSSMAVAVMPEGPLQKLLDTPAAYADPLSALHIRLSPSMLLRSAPPAEEDYYCISNWLHDVHLPLYAIGTSTEQQGILSAMATWRAAQIARLCGCCLIYDLSCLDDGYFRPSDFELVNSTAFALFMLVQRIATGACATLEADRHLGGKPFLKFCFTPKEKKPVLRELLQMQEEALARDQLLAIGTLRDHPDTWIICTALRTRDPSVEGLKPYLLFPTTPDDERFYPIFLDEVIRHDTDTDPTSL